MPLREQAVADFAAITSDTSGGFAHDILVTDPNGNSATLAGLSNDISQSINPDTGMLVSGRAADVVFARGAFTAAGLDQPTGVQDTNRYPWVVEWTGLDGRAYKFKIADALPDRGTGGVRCVLEAID